MIKNQGTLAGPIGRLVELFGRLPGIGRKTATRLTFHILNGSDDYAKELAACLVDLKELIHPCQICHTLTDGDTCTICKDHRRDLSKICVVAGTADLMAIESIGSYMGLYHVLGGVISPLDGLGPDKLTINSLANRLKSGQAEEIILALNPSVDGEATSLYLARLLSESFPHIKVSRIASGIPLGGNLEWVDGHTLARALQDRRTI